LRSRDSFGARVCAVEIRCGQSLRSRDSFRARVCTVEIRLEPESAPVEVSLEPESVTAITLVSCLPLYILKYLRRRFSPPSYSKLTS
ncbi:hypothetical protein cypCar_00021893, partial [Cyprinus carpio]